MAVILADMASILPGVCMLQTLPLWGQFIRCAGLHGVGEIIHIIAFNIPLLGGALVVLPGRILVDPYEEALLCSHHPPVLWYKSISNLARRESEITVISCYKYRT